MVWAASSISSYSLCSEGEAEELGSVSGVDRDPRLEAARETLLEVYGDSMFGSGGSFTMASQRITTLF